MSLLDKLIKVDKTTLPMEEKKVKSERLKKWLGTDTDVEITLRQIPARRLNDIIGITLDKNGRRDMSKNYDMNLMICVEGIVDPPVKERELMEHFGASTPKELCEKLFDTEANIIAQEISELSSLKEKEEDVKN